MNTKRIWRDKIMIKKLINENKRLKAHLGWHEKNQLQLENICDQVIDENDKLIEALITIANIKETEEETPTMKITRTPSLESVQTYAKEVLEKVQANDRNKLKVEDGLEPSKDETLFTIPQAIKWLAKSV